MNKTSSKNQAMPKGNVLDPRTPALAQPFKRLVEEGFITELTVKFTPMGTTVTGRPDSRMVKVVDSGLSLETDFPVGQLASVAEKGNLIPRKGKSPGKKGQSNGQPLPTKSLHKEDFALSPAEFKARCESVASACSGATLVGRVRSAGNFDGSVTTSFQDWWKSAGIKNRASALIQKKYSSEITQEQLKRLAGLSCPFRGIAEFTVSQEHDEGEEEEEPQIPDLNVPTRRSPPSAAQPTVAPRK